MIQCYNVIKNESGVFILQIITFIFVVLPLLFIISLFQRKKKRPIVRRDYGITMVLGIIGVFLASIILTLTKDGSALSINLMLGSIVAGIAWGILVSITLFILNKILNK